MSELVNDDATSYRRATMNLFLRPDVQRATVSSVVAPFNLAKIEVTIRKRGQGLR
jgi:hypothetical protein